jgi:hypothetical protein
MTSPIMRSSASPYLGSRKQERLEAGLRILARMIAAAYKRRLREAEVQGAQTAGNTQMQQESRLPKVEKGAGYDGGNQDL